jgi:hypothetical protein
MSVIRFGNLMQPAWSRTTAAFVDTTSSVAEKLQPAFDRTAVVGQQAAGLAGIFLTPVAVLAFVLGAWRLSADLGWTGEFFISDGLLSHWQVWMALGFAAQLAGSALTRAARIQNASREED